MWLCSDEQLVKFLFVFNLHFNLVYLSQQVIKELIMKQSTIAPVAEAENDAKKTDKLSRFIEKVKEDKESVGLFFDGKITRSELHARGIKFIKAL